MKSQRVQVILVWFVMSAALGFFAGGANGLGERLLMAFATGMAGSLVGVLIYVRGED